jgi:hypothetical protein
MRMVMRNVITSRIIINLGKNRKFEVLNTSGEFIYDSDRFQSRLLLL